MGFDGVDKTDRFIIAARRRAEAALHETSPKLTALEKAMWLKLKRGDRSCKNSKASQGTANMHFDKGGGRPSQVEETAQLARLCIFKPVM